MDAPSHQDFCALLTLSRLLTADEVHTLPARWGGPKDCNAEDFARWLTAKQYLTDYQAGVLLRGRIGVGRIGVGRMAGAYKAVHRLGQVVAVKVLPPSRVKDPRPSAAFSARRGSRPASTTPTSSEPSRRARPTACTTSSWSIWRGKRWETCSSGANG